MTSSMRASIQMPAVASAHAAPRARTAARMPVARLASKLSISGPSFARATTARVVAARNPAGRVAFIVRAGWGDPVDFSSATVKSSVKLTDDLYSITMDAGEIADGFTAPGQYVQLKVGDSKPAFIAIASAPAKGAPLEFLIKTGDGTAGLLCGLAPGAECDISTAQGKGFPMANASPDACPTLLLVATGSGISPIKSLIESGATKGYGDVKLYYGARDFGSMAFKDKFDEWAKMGVQVIPVYSQPKDGFEGNKGYVQDFALDGAAGAETGAVLCGQKEMTTAIIEGLEALGVARENILMNF